MPFHPEISEASDIEEKLRRDRGRGIAAAGGGICERSLSTASRRHGVTAFADDKDVRPGVGKSLFFVSL
jgi:hypothetical protein